MPFGPDVTAGQFPTELPASALVVRPTRRPRAGAEAAPARARAALRRRLVLPCDALVALVASAALLRGEGPVALRPLDAAVALLWVCVLAGSRAYDASPVTFGAEDVRRALRAGLAITAAGLALLHVRADDTEAVRLLLLAAVTSSAAIVERWLATEGIDLVSRRTPPTVRVVVTGQRRAAQRLVSELRTTRSRFDVVAVCVTGSARTDAFDVPVTSGLPSLSSSVAEHRADAVIVVPSRHLDPRRLRRLGWELEGAGTHLFVATGLADVGPSRASIDHTGAVPLLHVEHAALRGVRRTAKEIWERLAAALVLAALTPALLTLALVVRLDSKGPALFRQTRIGKDGAPFTMLKFRTMTIDAEQRKAALAPSVSSGSVLFKLQDDPRVTRVGRLLRRYSLDELPQLLNVVRGDMALVGPRPPLPCEVELYDLDTRRRLAVTPGLTGLWQVSGRSDLSWEESVRLDLRYVENWSIGLDLRILCRTVKAVLGHHGAY
jgi:exopolysaccharide biosynthesis polyprenyl glycosylphosphotransferase